MQLGLIFDDWVETFEVCICKAMFFNSIPGLVIFMLQLYVLRHYETKPIILSGDLLDEETVNIPVIVRFPNDGECSFFICAFVGTA